MRDDLTHTTDNPLGELPDPTTTRRRSTKRARGRISLAPLLVAGMLSTLVPTDRALALDPSILFMWCAADSGETDKQMFQFSTSSGTVNEFKLICKNNATVIATVETDSSGESVRINSEMDLGGQTVQTTEVVPTPEADPSQEEKTILEREHKAPDPDPDDGLGKAKENATAILEFIRRNSG